MKGLLIVACATAVALALPARASAQAHPHSAKADMKLTTQLVVGTAIVKPGEYRVQCRNTDGRDYLVVTSVTTGKEVARVPCRPIVLDEKVTATAYATTTREDGARQLTSVRIKGETIAHGVAE